MRTGRLVATLVGGGVFVLLAASPSTANEATSQASATAAAATLVGASVGTGSFVASNDGGNGDSNGSNTPVLPLLGGQQLIIAGVLGQDAVAGPDGTSAACAGLVGRNGAIQVGPNGTCIGDPKGRVSISIGSLDQLGLGKLISLGGRNSQGVAMQPALPALDLRVEASAVVAGCYASGEGSSGSSTVADAELVGYVGGKRLSLADIPAAGEVSVGLDDVVDGLPEIGPLGASARAVVEGLPTDELLNNELLTVASNVKSTAGTGNTTSALRVAALPDALADVTVGTVSCGPNDAAVLPGVPGEPGQPGGGDGNGGDDGDLSGDVPTNVPAGLAAQPAADASRVGLAATIVLVALAGIALAGLLYQRRRGQV
jgi:hypothetical protein